MPGFHRRRRFHHGDRRLQGRYAEGLIGLPGLTQGEACDPVGEIGEGVWGGFGRQPDELPDLPFGRVRTFQDASEDGRAGGLIRPVEVRGEAPRVAPRRDRARPRGW